jgi:starvation-inducible DNA-binding protein
MIKCHEEAFFRHRTDKRGKFEGISFLTRLTEQSIQSNDSKGHIKELLADHESIITYCREKIYKEALAHFDVVTCDFITTLIGKHEKTAWILRSQLETK